MWITRVLGDCPRCSARQTYGNASISNNILLRGCMVCRHHEEFWLPDLHKKIIYLDQSFFSGAFRARDPRFVHAAEHIKSATGNQLLVAPYSSLHEDETHQWRGHDGKLPSDLMSFIKQASGGNEFEADYEVERRQIVKAFKAYLVKEPATYVLDSKDVLRGNIHKWENYIFISIDGYFRDIEELRNAKADAVSTLIHAFDEWQTSNNSFEEDVNIENRAAGRIYIQLYLEMLGKIAGGDYYAYLNAPIATTIVDAMRGCLSKEMPLTDQLEVCAQFFNSPHFFEVPSHWVSAHIYATLKHQVKHGSYANREEAKKRLSGIFFDVKHISLYGPYCDAITVDGPMADLILQPTVNLQARYGTSVFSVGTFDQLENWLEQLKANMSEEHAEAVRRAYG